jgi:DNA-binding CsgD family transcriptional regulator
MGGDNLLATIEAIHAAGLDDAHWPQALAAIATAVGGNAASLEVIDTQTLRHRAMYSHGLPRADELAYLEQFAQTNVRLPFVVKQKLGELSWDYMILDERAMQRAPFYAEFMPRLDVRYFVSGIVLKTASEFAGVCVHRSARMGHIQRGGIAAMRTLVPHVRQAFDVSRRLKRAGDTRHQLERTLDWLADGVALLRADGAVIYANASLQAMARRSDGVRLRKNGMEFANSEGQQKFNSALATILRLKAGEVERAPVADFIAGRSARGQPYLVSMRPLIGGAARRQPTDPVAIVFVRDPLASGAASVDMLRELFALTEAEAALAQALQSGMTLADYAGKRALSLNTVYTHLRRLREKTGCSRMPELIHKLNELRVPLRPE